MARKYLMTWVAARNRWTKLYKGDRHWVSCKALGVPPTKEASYQAANAWWVEKQAEIDDTHAATAKPGSVQMLEQWYGVPIENDTDRTLLRDRFIEEFRDKPLPRELVELALGKGRAAQQVDTAEALQQPTDTDKSVGHQVERWVEIQRALVSAGEITPDRADNNRIALFHFRDFLGEATPVESIDASRLHEYFLWCVGRVGERKWSPSYAVGVFRIARSFIRHLWEHVLIELPRNIESRQFRFGVTAKVIQQFSVDELHTLVNAAAGIQLQLHLMLMMNCGMLQTDISDLLQTEVEWSAGRIIRKRSKTADHDQVPTVNYQLWPLTWELLKKYRSTNCEFALLTQSGRRWVDKRMVDGKLIKADNIASCYANLKRKTGIKKPLKLIRKTSASMIETHPEYGRYKSLFLGHAPRSLVDRHYAAPSQNLFDQTVAWLGKQYGY